MVTEYQLLEPGSLVDHFKILRLLGRGGMGEVYLARDTKLGRKVALKRVNPDSVGSRSALERFLMEARITARFNHPHIVTIHAVGETPGGPYVALEYLEGRSLRRRLDEERPSLAEILRIALAAAEALKEAHAHSILHLDLKPENIFIPRDGRIRVLDFGLSRIFARDGAAAAARDSVPGRASDFDGLPFDDDAFETVELKRGGAPGSGRPSGRGIFGSPFYMAPEQWNQEPFTGATDIWALGMILHEAVTGKHMFQGEPVNKVCFTVCKPDPLPSVKEEAADLPAAMADLIDRCLAKSPADRPSAEEAARTLDQWLSGRPRRTAEEQNPFRGLLPFAERHAEFFFGREDEVTAFMERIREETVLPVVGPSGAGKSSFIQAGILPRLREQGRWRIITLRPGSQPFRTLAARLLTGESTKEGLSFTTPLSSIIRKDEPPAGEPPEKPGSGPGDDVERLAAELQEIPSRLALILGELAELNAYRILLFVDQLEELYTMVGDEAVRLSFMQAVYSAADDPQGPVRVVFTLRDDFMGRLAEGPEARDALSRLIVLRSPGPEALRDILTRPLERVGYGWEDEAFIETMISDVMDEQSALPLLQFACHMLWERRDRSRRILTREAYASIGGVAGALARYVDGNLEGLSSSQMRLVREIFLRLVTPEKTRRIVPRRELIEELGDEAADILERLTRARAILVRRARAHEKAGAELELIHESLIKNWEPLARWIDESREELVFLAEAGQAAELWEKRGRREDEVWAGQALSEAFWKIERCSGRVPEKILRFLEAGRAKERKRILRRRILFASGGVLLALIAAASLVFSLTLSQKEREAQTQKKRAEERSAEALREGARAALMGGNLLEARAKVRSSLEMKDSALVRALWWRLLNEPLVWRKTLCNYVYDVAVSPDGGLVAGACHNHSIILVDAATSDIRVLRGFEDQITSLDFSPDGKTLAAGTFGGSVLMRPLEDDRTSVLEGHKGRVTVTRFSPDGKLFATASEQGAVMLWDAKKKAPLRTLEGHEGMVRALAFSPDSKTIASAGMDRTVRVCSAVTGVEALRLEGHEGAVTAVVFTADGGRIVTGSDDQTVRWWDAQSGKNVRVSKGQKAGIDALHIGPDGKVLASGVVDSLVRVWSVESQDLTLELAAHTGAVKNIRFSPDGNFLVSGSADGSVGFWDVTHTVHGSEMTGHSGGVDSAAFSPDGKILASSGLDGKIILWDVATGAQKKTITGHTNMVRGLSFSPAGDLLASGGEDRSVRLWDAATGEQVKSLWGHGDGVFTVGFSPDGSLLASGSDDGSIRIWDTVTGANLRTLTGHGAEVISVSFGPGGSMLASGSYDRTVRLWDPVKGTLLATLEGHTQKVGGAGLSPDGTLVASGGYEGTVRIWDVLTGSSRVAAELDGRVYCLGFHPDGKRVGAPCSDGKGYIINVEDGSMVELKGHRSEVNYVRFSPDGTLAATTSDDGTLRLWDADTGHPIWRAPLMLHDPAELFTHTGWIALEPAAEGAGEAGSAWRQAVEKNARQASGSADGKTLCVRTHDETLELWDMDSDEKVLERSLPGFESVLAVPDGCVSLAKGEARLEKRSGESVLLGKGAGAISVADGRVLVAGEDGVHVLSTDGKRLAIFPADPGVTAMTMVGDRLVLGFKEGGIEPAAAKDEKKKPAFAFEDVPSAPVAAMIPGPLDTLIVGYDSGLLGIWSLESGTRLYHVRLHGPVVHLFMKGDSLFAASELGDLRILDLGIFHRDYCELLREIWSKVGIVWEEGTPKVRKPPEGHACSPST
jgi:WD40 repeat protein/serine/threonine protein kinase